MELGQERRKKTCLKIEPGDNGIPLPTHPPTYSPSSPLVVGFIIALLPLLIVRKVGKREEEGEGGVDMSKIISTNSYNNNNDEVELIPNACSIR